VSAHPSVKPSRQWPGHGKETMKQLQILSGIYIGDDSLEISKRPLQQATVVTQVE
jgi:hypothetical protein